MKNKNKTVNQTPPSSLAFYCCTNETGHETFENSVLEGLLRMIEDLGGGWGGGSGGNAVPQHEAKCLVNQAIKEAGVSMTGDKMYHDIVHCTDHLLII